MRCSITLAVRLLVGDEAQVVLKESDGKCSIFLHNASQTPYVAETWPETLRLLRDDVFEGLQTQEKPGGLNSPGTETDSPQQGVGLALQDKTKTE
jgi:hypothetical protein